MYTKKDAVYGGYKVASLDKEHPLQQWTQACGQFCELRNRVNAQIKHRLDNLADDAETKGFVSQCSVAQLIVLEMDMTEELERLLDDINQPRRGSFTQKLLDHITIITSWSQRAQSMLNLSQQSTC